MHTAELLDEALSLAAQLGYRVRQEWLDGAGGGPCIVRGEKWLFVNLAQPLAEQLECLAAVLRRNPDLDEICLSSSLAEFLKTDENDQQKSLTDANFCQ